MDVFFLLYTHLDFAFIDLFSDIQFYGSAENVLLNCVINNLSILESERNEYNSLAIKYQSFVYEL